MKRKIISLITMMCLCIAMIACEQNVPTTNESNIITESSVETEDNTVKQEETISSETIDSTVVETETDIITETEEINDESKMSNEELETEVFDSEYNSEEEKNNDESDKNNAESDNSTSDISNSSLETSEPEEKEPTYTFTEVSKVVYAIETVGMYDVPTSDGNKLTTSVISAPYEVTGVCNETGWYRIVLGGNTIFASADAFADTKPNDESEMSNENNNSTSGIPNSSLEDGEGEGNNNPTPTPAPTPTPEPTPEPIPTCTHAYNFYKEEILNLRYEVPLEGGCEDTVCTYNFFCSNCHTLMKTEVEHHVAHMVKDLTSPTPATCTTDGLEGTSSCGCGALPIIGGKVIPAYGHNYRDYCTGECCYDENDVNFGKVKYITMCTRCDEITNTWWDF